MQAGNKAAKHRQKRKSFPWAAREKKQQKTCALCAQRTNDKQTPGAAQAGRKSGRRRVGRKTTPQKADTIAASLTHGRQGCSREHTPEHRAQKPPQQRLAAQERPACHMARHAGQKEPLRTGKIRVRSFACPEGPCEPGPPKIRFAVFGWHGLFLLRTAPRAAQNKRGRRPRSLACRLGCGLPVANRKHRPNREMRPALIRVPPARRFSPAGSGAVCQWQTGSTDRIGR